MPASSDDVSRAEDEEGPFPSDPVLNAEESAEKADEGGAEAEVEDEVKVAVDSEPNRLPDPAKGPAGGAACRLHFSLSRFAIESSTGWSWRTLSKERGALLLA